MSADEPRLQAHQLVYCAKCYLPYDQRANITEVVIPEDAEARSWYLTNCAHTICSKCLFPNGRIYSSISLAG
jgi:zinc-RING finger domain